MLIYVNLIIEIFITAFDFIIAMRNIKKKLKIYNIKTILVKIFDKNIIINNIKYRIENLYSARIVNNVFLVKKYFTSVMNTRERVFITFLPVFFTVLL